MKGKIRVLGFIALTAIIALGMASCDMDGSGSGEFEMGSGTLSLNIVGNETTSTNEDAEMGNVLEALYEGEETDLNFIWYRDGIRFDPSYLSSATAKMQKHMISEFGRYTVRVEKPGKDGGYTCPKAVTVKAAEVNFYGTWTMIGADNLHYPTANTPAPGVAWSFDETLTVSATQFYFQDDTTFKDPLKTTEFLDYTIDSWEKVDADVTASGWANWFDLTGGNTKADKRYSSAYKLTGTKVDSQGYADPGAFFYIIIHEDGKSFIRTRDGESKIVLGRVYIKQP